MAPPYRLGKGPVVIALQRFLAEGDVELWYSQLVDEKTYLEELNPTEFDIYLEVRDPESYKHTAQDVFGPGQDAALLPPDQLAAAKRKGISRRLVYGRGLRRALEIAYGFGEGSQPRDRPWTIDLFWGCGQPFNSVALSTNPATEVVTVVIYSDGIATPDGRIVVPRDATKPIAPDPSGLYFVDDRRGVERVSEWEATKAIGFADSPDAA